MKRLNMSRCIGLMILVAGAGTSGCYWDDGVYDTFVNNGKVIVCENMKAIQIGDYRCTASGCEGDCRADVRAKCEDFINDGAFAHGICPKEYAQCLDGVCQLSPCMANQHMGPGGCEPDTVNACGTADNDCLSRPGWVNAVCDNGTCYATECSAATKLVDGNCELGECEGGFLAGGECVKSTVERCGSVSNNCSITVPGWDNGDCIENICVPSSCVLGYHLNDSHSGCVADTNEVCGESHLKCDAGQVCTGGECRENCGTGEVLCSVNNVMTCADPNTNTQYCGVLEGCVEYTACDTEAGEVCVAGECKQYRCNAPDTLCSTANGNECINVGAEDEDNCGACGYSCADHDIQNAKSNICLDGACQYTCETGYVNVGTGKTSQTIECIDPKTDSRYCGATSDVDPGESCGAGKVCVDGSCVYNSCSSPDTLCSATDGNQCINVRSDRADHCGACNYKCSEHAIQDATSNACAGGECQYVCNTGFVNVGDGATSQTIKCIDPATDRAYCGATATSKGIKCGSGQVCVDRKCVYNSCSSPDTLCSTSNGNACINVNSNDSDHCGTCNYKCSDHPIPHATSDGCGSGKCIYVCESGYVNVALSVYADGIKCVDPKTDNRYCGAISALLPGETCGSGKVCVDGKCVYNSCSSPDTLCSTSTGNQCINVNSNKADNCGTCNYKCSEHKIPHASSNTCASGECQYKCDGGYVNVGSGITDKTILCIDPKTDSKYCNAAGNASGAASNAQKGTPCGSGEVCVNGSCVVNSCSSGTLCYVSGKNTCIDINGKVADHCGACNYKCSDHAMENAAASTCENGECIYGCTNKSHVNVGKDYTAKHIKCIDPKTDNTYCGAKSYSEPGKTCTSGQVCVNGACVYNSCTDTNLTLCSTSTGNQCINVNSDKADHCGTCNYKCSDHRIQYADSDKCVKGECQYVCDRSHVNVGEDNTAKHIKCIDPRTDNTYCGAKSYDEQGTTCTDGMVCVDSVCVPNSCSGDTPDLCVVGSGDAKTNVCVNVSSMNANHCGACNYVCNDNPIKDGNVIVAESSSCADGECQYKCAKVRGIQYVNVGTGVTRDTIHCVDPTSNATYCGATGNVLGNPTAAQIGTDCNTSGNASAGRCNDSKCTITECAYEFHMVGSGASASCEANTNESCGSRDSDDAVNCTILANKTICDASSGRCFIGSCIENAHEDTAVNACVCDADAHEYTLNSVLVCESDSADHCQGHGETCMTTGVETADCVNKQCVALSCVTNYHITREGTGCEVNTISDCGDNHTECPTAENGSAQCSANGECSLYCNNTNSYPDLCKDISTCVNFADDVNHCGGCDKKCDVAHASNDCVSGGCTFVCNDGFHEHDNGCEADTTEHCGAHGSACNVAHASNDCVSGGCTFVCNDGFHEHDNGCEADTTEHCGAHGSACNVAHASNDCVAGSCTFVCNDGFHNNSDGDGCEENTVAHCSSPMDACLAPDHATPTCINARCEFECADNYTSNDTRCILTEKYCENDGATRCVNNGTAGEMQECVDNEWTDTNPCGDNVSCNSSGTACGVCVNGANQCDGRTPQTCTDGAWVSSSECASDKICDAGSCVSCDAGTHVYDNGCEPDDNDNCGAHENACDADKLCVDGSCVGD